VGLGTQGTCAPCQGTQNKKAEKKVVKKPSKSVKKTAKPAAKSAGKTAVKTLKVKPKATSAKAVRKKTSR
jgi:hypothetical protein